MINFKQFLNEQFNNSPIHQTARHLVDKINHLSSEEGDTYGAHAEYHPDGTATIHTKHDSTWEGQGSRPAENIVTNHLKSDPVDRKIVDDHYKTMDKQHTCPTCKLHSSASGSETKFHLS